MSPAGPAALTLPGSPASPARKRGREDGAASDSTPAAGAGAGAAGPSATTMPGLATPAVKRPAVGLARTPGGRSELVPCKLRTRNARG
jgi:hypothetical protein